MDSGLFPVHPRPIRDRGRDDSFDLAVIGATALGLAHALTAARHGRRVVVLDSAACTQETEALATGLVAVTGQPRGVAWRRAHRGAEQWEEIAQAMGLDAKGHGAFVVARTDAEARLLEDALDGGEAIGCRLHRPIRAVGADRPAFEPPGSVAILESPFERRFDPREALATLVAWLADVHGVAFRWGTTSLAITDRGVETVRGLVRADHVVVCCLEAAFRLDPEGLAARGVAPGRAALLRGTSGLGAADPRPALIRSASSLAAALGRPPTGDPDGDGGAPDTPMDGPCIADPSADPGIVPESRDTLLVGPVAASSEGADSEGASDEERDGRALTTRSLDRAGLLLGSRPRLCERRFRPVALGVSEPVVIATAANARLVIAPDEAAFGLAFAIAEDVLDEVLGLSVRVAAMP
ncbi:MAG: FAD-dependent oxidoreductase [Azospirillaceae bacterium]